MIYYTSLSNQILQKEEKMLWSFKITRHRDNFTVTYIGVVTTPQSLMAEKGTIVNTMLDWEQADKPFLALALLQLPFLEGGKTEATANTQHFSVTMKIEE